MSRYATASTCTSDALPSLLASSRLDSTPFSSQLLSSPLESSPLLSSRFVFVMRDPLRSLSNASRANIASPCTFHPKPRGGPSSAGTPPPPQISTSCVRTRTEPKLTRKRGADDDFGAATRSVDGPASPLRFRFRGVSVDASIRPSARERRWKGSLSTSLARRTPTACSAVSSQAHESGCCLAQDRR